MSRRSILIIIPAFILLGILLLISQAQAQTDTPTDTQAMDEAVPMADGVNQPASGDHDSATHHYISQEDREKAADVAKSYGAQLPQLNNLPATSGQPVTAAMDPQGVPDYFGTIPNYANSPFPQIQGLGPARDYYGAV